MILSKKNLLAAIAIFLVLTGCMGAPLRPALREDISVPSGKIEGNQFIGIRYPFKVSVPPHWKLTTEFPDFLTEFGYTKPSPTDKEQTELYAYHPETKSNINFDFTPVGQYAAFDQEKIERLADSAADVLKSEVRDDYGQYINIETGPTEPISLKGVQFAAKKYVTFTAKGVKREQGWIYGFTEPYQIFILYTIVEKGGTGDRDGLKAILDSFEVVSK